MFSSPPLPRRKLICNPRSSGWIGIVVLPFKWCTNGKDYYVEHNVQLFGKYITQKRRMRIGYCCMYTQYYDTFNVKCIYCLHYKMWLGIHLEETKIILDLFIARTFWKYKNVLKTDRNTGCISNFNPYSSGYCNTVGTYFG